MRTAWRHPISFAFIHKNFLLKFYSSTSGLPPFGLLSYPDANLQHLSRRTNKFMSRIPFFHVKPFATGHLGVDLRNEARGPHLSCSVLVPHAEGKKETSASENLENVEESGQALYVGGRSSCDVLKSDSSREIEVPVSRVGADGTQFLVKQTLENIQEIRTSFAAFSNVPPSGGSQRQPLSNLDHDRVEAVLGHSSEIRQNVSVSTVGYNIVAEDVEVHRCEVEEAKNEETVGAVFKPNSRGRQQNLEMEVESTYRILARGVWGPDKEIALNALGLNFGPNYTHKVLRRQLNVDMAWNFFKWAGYRTGGSHTGQAYSIMTGLLGTAKRFQEVEEIMAEAAKKGVRLSPETFIRLGRNYGKVGLLEKAVESLNRMKEYDFQVTVFAYNSLIDSLVKAGYHHKALAVYKIMGQSGLQPDTYTFNILMHAFKKARDIDSVCKLYEEMQNQHCKPDVVTFSTLIDAFCKSGAIDEAARVFTEMKLRGYRPNIFTYNSLIDGMCKVGRVDKAFDLFEKMTTEGIVASTVTYNIFISGLGRSGRVDAAGKLFREMLLKGFTPDVVTYSSLVHGLGIAGRANEARKVFKEARDRGFAVDESIYNVLIDTLCKAEKMDEAWQVFGEMEEEGYVPDAFTFNSLMDGLCKGGRIQDAFTLLEDMKRAGCAPDVAVYNTLIDGLRKANKVEEAGQLLQEMQSSGCEPDTITFNILIDELCKGGRLDDAFKLFEEMTGKDCADIVTYNSLLHGLCLVGWVDEAFKLFNEIRGKDSLEHKVSPDFVTYTTLLCGARQAGLPDLTNSLKRWRYSARV